MAFGQDRKASSATDTKRHSGLLRLLTCLLLLMLWQNSTAMGQGLLGRKYVGFNFGMSSPNNETLKTLNDWSYGVRLMGNLPLSETLDFHAEVGSDWFDGSTTVGTVPVEFDLDVTSFTLQLNKHLLPEGTIDPFAGIGIGYSKATARASIAAVSDSATEDQANVSFVAGFEWKPHERFSIRPQIESGDSLEDLNLDDLVDDHLFVTTYFTYWCNDNFFTSFGIGSDFDDTEVRLEFLIGLGEW